MKQRQQWYRWQGWAAGLLVIVGVILPRPVAAHPLGNFTINRYSRLEVGDQQIRLRYVLDMAEVPTFQAQADLDRNHDGDLSAAEQSAYATTLLATIGKALELRVADQPIALKLEQHQLTFPAGQGGLPTLRLEADFIASLAAKAEIVEATYQDQSFAGRLGWREVVVLAAQPDALLTSNVPRVDQSQELRSYPQDLLASPPDTNTASFRVNLAALKGATNAERPAVASTGRVPDQLAALIAQPVLGTQALLLTLLLAFGLGASHALTPGHGKTVVAAYLVGSRGTTRHALLLGLTTTVTHTAGVFLLGLITLFVSQYVLPDQLYPWLSLVSGGLVVLLGAALMRQRWTQFRRPADADQPHSHLFGLGHTHDPDDPTSHTHQLPAGQNKMHWRNLVALGISGGLLPCPSALVVLLGAIALHRVALGMLLIIAFSLGLASVLTAIGLVLVHAGRFLERLPLRGRVLQFVPVASALVITLLGVGIAVQALRQIGFL